MPALSKAERNYHRQLFEDFNSRCNKLGMSMTDRASLFGTTVATYSSWTTAGTYSTRSGHVRKLRTPVNLKALNAALMRLALHEKRLGREVGPRHYLGDAIPKGKSKLAPPPTKVTKVKSATPPPTLAIPVGKGWVEVTPKITETPETPENDTHPYKVLLVNGKGVTHYQCDADPTAMLVDWVQRYGGQLTVVPKVEVQEVEGA